ncbi:hypothetical protein B0H13DRAFT_2650823 [Mycena leptocephala]|nr:hypothetical protein B0H13DRAFT_2650823 [Mycena leptocephala]
MLIWEGLATLTATQSGDVARVNISAVPLPSAFGRPAPLRTRFPLLTHSAETSARPRRIVLRGRELLSAHRRRQHTPPHHSPLFHITTAYAYDMHVNARRFRRFRPLPILSPRRLLSTRKFALVVLVLGRGSEHTAQGIGQPVSMNVVAQLRPWPTQEKTVYATAQRQASPIPTHFPFQRRRGLVRGPQLQPERGRAAPRRAGLHRRQPGAEHQRRDKPRSTHFSARMTEYFILRSGTALDSPPPLLPAQVMRSRVLRGRSVYTHSFKVLHDILAVAVPQDNADAYWDAEGWGHATCSSSRPSQQGGTEAVLIIKWTSLEGRRCSFPADAEYLCFLCDSLRSILCREVTSGLSLNIPPCDPAATAPPRRRVLLSSQSGVTSDSTFPSARSSRMVRYRRCSPLVARARVSPWPPLSHQHGSSLADCARGSLCIQTCVVVTSGFIRKLGFRVSPERVLH